MIRKDKEGSEVRKTTDYSCMSYDVPNLPTNLNKLGGYIPTSSSAYVIDTAEVYIYTEDDESWYLQ